MSQSLADLLTEIKKITTLNDLLLIQQTLTTQMQTVAAPTNSNGNGGHAVARPEVKSVVPTNAYADLEPYVASEEIHPEYIKLPGTTRISPEYAAEVHQQLKAMLPSKDWEEFENRDFSDLVFEGKSTSQMIIEDREDRI
jgi:hypothetical protein